MKRIMVICFLLAACSDEQLNAFIDGLSKSKFTVHFDFNVYRLSAQTKEQLDSLVSFLKLDSVPVSKIEITGHCDSVGSKGYNDVLSIKRAQEVSSYLHSKGIGDSIITSVRGFGKRRLLSDNQSDNRRVEIMVRLKLPAKVDSAKAKSAERVADTTGIKTIDISHAQVNDIIQLPDINFYPDRHLIIDASRQSLKILLNTMLVNKTLRIEIRGHVCCLPDYQGDAFDDDTYTDDLSLQRAKEIYLFLAENSIARDRMTYIGLGAKYPLVKEFTEHDKAMNRRVEIKILSK
jgi:outer membrane protein OmpA-like peptidoglycan-associated protein